MKIKTYPEITRYRNYRNYIADCYAQRRSNSPKFSLAFCAKALKTSAPYLKHVMTKKRHVSIDKLPAIARLFGLSTEEKRYLVFLFLHETSRDADLKNYFESVIGVLRAQIEMKKVNSSSSSETIPACLEDWLSHAIHGLAHFKDFSTDPNWIRQHLIDAPSAEDVKFAVQKLLTSGEIVKEDGRFKAAEFFHTPDPTRLETFKVYQVLLDKTSESINRLAQYKDAQFYMGCLPTDKAGMNQMFDALGKLAFELKKISESTKDPSHVVMMSLNLLDVCKAPVEPSK